MQNQNTGEAQQLATMSPRVTKLGDLQRELGLTPPPENPVTIENAPRFAEVLASAKGRDLSPQEWEEILGLLTGEAQDWLKGTLTTLHNEALRREGATLPPEGAKA